MRLALFYGIALLILLFTLTVALAKKNNELKKRCLTLILLVTLICAVILAGKTAFTVFIISIVVIAAIEITKLCYNSTYKIAMSIVLVLITLTILNCFDDSLWCLAPAALILYLVLNFAKPRFLNNEIRCWTCLILVVIPGCISLIYLFNIGYVHIIALILLVQFNDGFSYLTGKRFGKTHLKYICAISPNKTLEGYAGGMAGVILSILILNIVFTAYPVMNMLVRSIILLIVVFVFANAGDLAFSALKRKLGVKDFSNILAGHGGVLDRFDSILFLSPVYLLLIVGGIL